MTCISLARAARSAACSLALLAGAAQAQRAPTLSIDDYAHWETLGASMLSRDGRWVAFTVSRGSGDVELRFRAVAHDSTTVVPHAAAPEFASDGRWLAYVLGTSAAERDRRAAAAEPVRSRIHLVDLQARHTVDLGEFAAFQFSADAKCILLRGHAPAEDGSDLVIRDLVRGTDVRFARVTTAAWRGSGAVVAFVTAHAAGQSVQLYNAADRTLRTLASDSAEFAAPAWRAAHDDLAVLRRPPSPDRGDMNWSILHWRGASTNAPRLHTLDPAAVPALAAHHVVSTRDLKWSDDGRALFFGVRVRTSAADTSVNPAERAGVEVWHSADVEIVPERKVRSDLEATLSEVAVWHIAQGRVVRLAGDALEGVSLSSGRYALGLDAARYAQERMFGPQLRDLYVIDTETGERALVAPRVQYQQGISPGGRYILYVRDGHFHTVDTRTHRHTNITADVPARFINDAHDFPVRDKPPYGVAGWTPDDRSVLLHDRYDLWEVRSDGSGAVRLTDGAAERIRHRRIWLDPDDRIVDLARPTFVALHGETTRKTGFARVRRGRTAERLLFMDAHLSRLSRATDADVFMYRVERFDDSPDLFVAGPMLADARQVSSTNEHQSRFAWGRSELIPFISAGGVALQGALFYPADYQPGRRYPLVVDVYETVSNTLHTYVVPTDASMHNTTVFTQNGYFVLKPDIAYRTRDPGVSAVDAIVPAVRQALATGMIDSTRIALVGHSWGAYQTAFTITQTRMFAAAIAAAPLTNMISMYLSIYWNTGGTDARMFEIEQGRMEVPFWQDVDAYIRNSPVFHIENMDTPLLVAFGDRDGAVDWHQGIELYNAARRAGKQLVLLVYRDENHSLAQKQNQRDYHRRTNEWLAHYLKGEPPAAWIIGRERADSAVSRTRVEQH